MIRINDGKFEVEWKEGMTIEDLLKACNFTYPMVVVSVNGQVVRREDYATHPLADGDEVKVLHLISGG